MIANNLILNRLFTQNVLQDFVNGDNNPIYGTIIQRYVDDVESKSNGELLSEIYQYMAKCYRNEYFYQNTLLNKLLLGKHSIRTTTALTQIPIGKSKADFVLINGKAVVYEIKSELDGFDRLKTQLKDYYKAFNHVCVVVPESNFDRLVNALQGTSVGIYTLTKKDTFSNIVKKEPIEDNSHLNHTTIFKVLHKREFENIIKNHFGELPIASQVFYYDACLEKFSEIPILIAYKAMLSELKKRNKIIESRFQDIPYELKSLTYFSGLSSEEFDELHGFLNQKFEGVV